MQTSRLTTFVLTTQFLATLANSQAIVRSFQQTPVPLTQIEVRGDKVVFAGSGVDAGSFAYRVYLADRDGDILKTMGGTLTVQRKLTDLWVSPSGSIVYGVLENLSSDTLTIFKCDTDLGAVIAQRDLTSNVGPAPRINGRSVTVDSAGNVYVSGSFQDSNFKWAGYIAKYDGNLNLLTYYTTPLNNTENVFFDKIFANPWGGLCTLGGRQTNSQFIGEVRDWSTNLASQGTLSLPLVQTASSNAMGAVDGNAVYMANTVILPQQILTARKSSATGESFLSPVDLSASNCAIGQSGFYVCGTNNQNSLLTPMFMKMSVTSPFQSLVSRDVPVPGHQGSAHAIVEKSGGCVLAGTVTTGSAFVSWQDSSGGTIYQDFVLGGVQQPNDIATNPFQNKAYIVSQTTGSQSYKGQLTVFVDEPPIDPNTFVVTKGRVLSGGLSSLTTSDGNSLVVLPNHLDLQAEFTATTPYTQQYAINVVVFGTTGVSANVKIEMWNWSSGDWETAGIGQQGTLFSQVIAPIGVAPDRFVEPGTRLMKGRVTYRFDRLAKGSPSASSENMLAKIDMFKVYVTAP
ncbi:MAG: SBBP repeat-containing protein [Chthonomonadaceae bacterium]|nr:SBBP repeat-containing protein [Chthonomonadaceae bacterium]